MDDKVGQLIDRLTQIQIQHATVAERLVGLIQRTEQDVSKLQRRIDRLERRPVGMTGRQLLAAAAGLSGSAAALATVIDHI